MSKPRDPARTARLTALIDAALARLDITDQRASLDALGKRDAIRDIRRGVIPSALRWQKICDRLGIVEGSADAGKSETSLTQMQPPLLFSAAPSRDLPLWTGVGGKMDAIGQPEAVTLIHRPSVLAGRTKAYAAYVTDENNAPILRPGHILYMDPSRPAAIGDLVRVSLVDGGAVVGIMLDNDGAGIAIRGAAETKARLIPAKKVEAVDFVAMHSRVAD